MNNSPGLDVENEISIQNPKLRDAVCLTAQETSLSPWLKQFFTCTISFCYLTICSLICHPEYGNQATQLRFHLLIQNHEATHGLCPDSFDPLAVAHQAPLSTLSLSLLTFMSIESAMLSNHLILCHPLLLLPLILPSIRVFSNEPASHIRAQNFRSISPSNKYSRLIYFRIGWFDLLAVQETLKSLFQHHSLKA